MIRSTVRGIGSALPKACVKNADLEGMVETNDEWIVQRTGIRQRYIADETETTASLGAAAAQAALDMAGLTRCRHRPDHRRDRNARQHISGDRGGHPEPARHDARLCLRCRRRLHRLHLWRSPPPIFTSRAAWRGGSLSSARRHFRAFSTGATAPPASCSATAPAR